MRGIQNLIFTSSAVVNCVLSLSVQMVMRLVIGRSFFIVGQVSLGYFSTKCSPLTYLYKKDGLTRDECVQHCKDNRYPYAGFDHCRKCFCFANFMTSAQIKSNACKTRPKPKDRNIKPGCKASSQIEVFRTSKSDFSIVSSQWLFYLQ